MKKELLENFETICNEIEKLGFCEDLISHCEKEIKQAQKKLKITQTQVILIGVLLNKGISCYATFEDIAKRLKLKPIKMLRFRKDLNEMVAGCYMDDDTDFNGRTSYCISEELVAAIQDNKPFVSTRYKCADTEDFFIQVNQTFKNINIRHLHHYNGIERLKHFFTDNIQIPFVERFQSLTKGYGELEKILVAWSCNLWYNYGQDTIEKKDLDAILPHKDSEHLMFNLQDDNFSLIADNIFQPACENGSASLHVFSLTDQVKKTLFEGIRTQATSNYTNFLKSHDSIIEKSLFFSGDTETQLNTISKFLEEEHYQELCRRMRSKGHNPNFCVLFYGLPGTGKTEMVMQLARQTGRDLFIVDYSELRDKFVGESEKNVTRIFDSYEKCCKTQKKTPIMLFNEGDAILCKRSHNAEHSVDKMENAIQNIILQRMENFPGIMIATTNLATNLDPAFERRFIFKVEFGEPSLEAKCAIWKQFIPDLTQEEIYALAQEFNFSGGYIENIAKKIDIESFLYGTVPSYEQIRGLCRQETINADGPTHKIGFR